jgi:hypothetical protein
MAVEMKQDALLFAKQNGGSSSLLLDGNSGGEGAII